MEIVTWIDLQTIDEFGYPVGNAELILILSDGIERKIQTDAKGYHKEEGIPKGEIKVMNLDGSPAKYLFKEVEEDAVLHTDYALFTITHIIVEHDATPEDAQERKDIKELYGRISKNIENIKISGRTQVLDLRTGVHIGETKKIQTRKSHVNTTDNLALASGWESGKNPVFNIPKFLKLLSVWLEDYHPSVHARGYNVHVLMEDKLTTYSSSGEILGNFNLTAKVVDLFGAFARFESSHKTLVVDMVNRWATLPVKSREDEIVPMEELIDPNDRKRFLELHRIISTKIEIIYNMPTSGKLMGIGLHGGTGLLENYGDNPDTNKNIHERNLKVVEWVIRIYNDYLEWYIGKVKQATTENDIRKLGPPLSPYVFPIPAGASEDAAIQLSKANIASSLHAWQAISDTLDKLAGRIPDGSFFFTLKVEVESEKNKNGLLGGGEIKTNIYFEQDGMPVMMKPEVELKFGGEGEKEIENRKVGIKVEYAIDPITLQRGYKYTGKLGVGEIEIFPEGGDVKIQIMPGGRGAGGYIEVNPKNGWFGGGIVVEKKLKKGNVKFYFGLYLQGLRKETLLAYFCHSPGFFERRSVEEIFMTTTQLVPIIVHDS